MITLYKFESLNTESNYLFQYVYGRKLSDIYHTHDFYEIIILVRGECIKLINDEEFICKKDSIIFLKPGDRHVFKSQSEDVCVASLSVEKKEFEMMLGIFESAPNINTTIFFCPEVYSKFCSLIGMFTNNPKENDCKLLLSYILRIFAGSRGSQEKGIPRDLLFAAEEMEKPENMKRGIDAFTELSHYSRSHLAKLMKKHYGMTVHEYLFDIRLSSAYRQITLTNTHLEDIAENVGYQSFSHFNQVFKKNFGITPAALRKSCKAWTV